MVFDQFIHCSGAGALHSTDYRNDKGKTTMKNARLPALALLLLVAAPGAAVTVYQNGDLNRSGGTSMTNVPSAQDFRLKTAASLTGVTLFALDLFGELGTLPMNYAIYADTAGSPGTTLASGIATDFAFTSFGLQGGFGDPEFRVSFRFAQAIDVGADTTYWLGLLYGDGTPGRGVLWSNIPGNGTLQGSEFRDGAWFTAFPEASFSLQTGVSAVPEPATWAMLAGGFGLAGASLRRRRAAAAAGCRARPCRAGGSPRAARRARAGCP